MPFNSVKKYSTLIFVFFVNYLYPQQYTFSGIVKINNSADSIKYIDLNIFNIIDCDNSFKLDSASFINVSYKNIDAAKISTETKKQIQIGINIKANQTINRKQKQITCSFLPIKYNSITGNYQIITNYEIGFYGVKINNNNKQLKSKKQSLLSSGNWYKIKVAETGIHKLTYEQLVSIGISEPTNVRVYNYGGKQLPYYNLDYMQTDMNENPIYMYYGPDNNFGPGDYILFYAQGPVTWSYNSSYNMFTHNLHPYSEFIYLFLTSDMGKGLRITNINQPLNEPNYVTNEFDDYQYHEIEKKNYIRSGIIFYGEKIAAGSSLDLSFVFQSLVTTKPVSVYSAIAAHTLNSAPTSKIVFSSNGTALKNIDVNNYVGDHSYGYRYTTAFTFLNNNNTVNINIAYTGGNSMSESYLDFVDLNARNKLSIGSKNQIAFRDKESLKWQTIQYNIDNNGKNITVWDITNPTCPYNVMLTTQNNISWFKTSGNTINEFIMFDGSSFLEPIITGNDVGFVQNQNLHALSNIDMVIVSHPDFIEQANELALFHETTDTLIIKVVTPQQVYNEFSSGTPDVSAIRNFMRYLYNNANNQNDMVKYLLLFGDGSYDNRTQGNGNSNYILTYQNSESMSETLSIVTDDFFGLLDVGEGEYYGTLDIGIGRFPVQTKQEAQVMVDKVKNYMSDKALGSWRTQICMIADDKDYDGHMEDANHICKIINAINPEYNINKIFFKAFPLISSPSGDRYPQVTDAINDQMQQGAFIVNYMGHGNPRILSHEEVLYVEDVINWKNYNKLPLFVTASCEVGRFDDYEFTSLGEWMALSPNGAGIAAFTTTRVVYQDSNKDLTTNFFSYVFDNNNRLGDVIRKAKNSTFDSHNKRSFSLLGDPALKLRIPENKAEVSSINNNNINPSTANSFNNYINTNNNDLKFGYSITQKIVDTLSALSKARVQGYLLDKNDNVIFKNGVLYPTIYDKSVPLVVLTTRTKESDTVFVQNNVLYKGKASITDGFFDFEFIVPKDINYRFGNGKISLYAVLDSMQAIGYNTQFAVGGSVNNIENDTQGPDIKLFMNDTLFTDGGLTNDNPVLLAFLTDKWGINTVGNGIGHNITAIIDNNFDTPKLLNTYYQSDLDFYNKGTVQYPLSNLEPGNHTITVKAWDIYNNSAEATINFVVKSQNNINIDKLFNAPNPFNHETYFNFEHNQADQNLNITITIFDYMGNKVDEIKTVNNNNGFKITPINWNGTNSSGSLLSNGLYIYRVTVNNGSGLQTTVSSKLMILR